MGLHDDGIKFIFRHSPPANTSLLFWIGSLQLFASPMVIGIYVAGHVFYI